MQFLMKLWKALGISSPSKAREERLSAEEVARFIYHKKDWYRATGETPAKAKPKIFLPELYESQWETSVCRTISISEQRIWLLANRARHPMPGLARANIHTNFVDNAGLYAKAAPDNERDYPEHAVIVGWPCTEDREDVKQKHMEYAVKLAYEAALIMPA